MTVFILTDITEGYFLLWIKVMSLNQTELTNFRESVDGQALIHHWQQVKTQIAQACQQQNRAEHQVSLLAVSKTKPVEMILTLAQQGQQDFGENYLQEALFKIEQIQKSGLHHHVSMVWHYIGHIQRNKTKDIASHFDWVQTVDRAIIAKRLNEQRPEHLPPLNILIQVNIDDEERKSGCQVGEVFSLIDEIQEFERLVLRGLMIIPAKDGSDAFSRTKALFNQIKASYPQLSQWDTLSMGMSGDLPLAISNGSTMVRVGSAIFGERS